jgi:hypothetical protein
MIFRSFGLHRSVASALLDRPTIDCKREVKKPALLMTLLPMTSSKMTLLYALRLLR